MPPSEETVALDRRTFGLMRDIVLAAWGLWNDENGRVITFLPNEGFEYVVPILIEGDEIDNELRQFYGRRSGEAFLPLLRAVQALGFEMNHDSTVRTLIDVPRSQEPTT